ncbi:hypothetical protein RHBI111906_05990 [Rhodothermus bifroesti]|nr:hypothetical protein HRbin18_00255 [bacterium HR18]
MIFRVRLLKSLGPAADTSSRTRKARVLVDGDAAGPLLWGGPAAFLDWTSRRLHAASNDGVQHFWL